MITSGVLMSGFRVSIFTLLIVATCGDPNKGSQFTGQSSSSANVNYAPYRGGGPNLASVPYSAVGDAYGSQFVQGPSMYQPVVVVPEYSSPGQPAGVSPVAEAGDLAAGVAQAGVPAAGGFPSAQAGLPAGGVSQASTFIPGLQGAAAYVASPQLYVPVAEHDAGSQDQQPETQWAVPPTDFSEAGSADIQDISDILLPAPPAPQGPLLQSGETSSVTKEAELGNYQQQTEEFGYPADLAGPGQGFGQGLATVLVSGVQQGGFRPMSAGQFDRMLLYGLYPPGSYSTFSQNHESGKDYSQAIHYLKEHVTSSHGSGQQKKFFPSAQ